LKRAHPTWIVTAAAHSLRAARRGGADAVVMSVALPSGSASAGRRWARSAWPPGPRRGRPAYALGGVNNKTARRLSTRA
jgi:thiamine-phosphate pyrophosphorylase